MAQVVIVGGVVNKRLKQALARLGIIEFTHYPLETVSISPEALIDLATRLYQSLSPTAVVIGVGKVAVKVLEKGYILHAAIPTPTKDNKKEVEESLDSCRKYLLLRRYYGTPPNNTIG